MVVKVQQLGNSLCVTLPVEAREKLRVRKGDKLYMTETPDGFSLTPYDPEFAKTMEIAEEGMRKYRNALRKLAK